MTLTYFCCDENRRAAVRLLNGIDSVVVEPPGSPLTTALAGSSGEVILVRALSRLRTPLALENVQVETHDGRAIELVSAGPVTGDAAALLTNPERYVFAVVEPG
ncbi:MAG TPA: hypothetical protein VGB98_18435, partial [Pyrinomonadaceae bacterium]